MMLGLGIGGSGARGGTGGGGGKLEELAADAANGDALIHRNGYGWRPKSRDLLGPGYFLNPTSRNQAFDVIRSARAGQSGSVSAFTDLHSGLSFSTPGTKPELKEYSLADRVLEFDDGAYLEADMAAATPPASTQPDGPLLTASVTVPAGAIEGGLSFKLPSLIGGPGEVRQIGGGKVADLTHGVRIKALFLDGEDRSDLIGKGFEFAGDFFISASDSSVYVDNGFNSSDVVVRVDYHDAENDSGLDQFEYQNQNSVIAVGFASSPSNNLNNDAFLPVVSFGKEDGVHWAIGVDDDTRRWAIRNQNETVVLSDAPYPTQSILVMKPDGNAYEAFVFQRLGSPGERVLREPAHIKRVSGQYLKAPDDGSVRIGRGHGDDPAPDFKMRLSSLVFSKFRDAELLSPDDVAAIARYVNAQEGGNV